MRKILILGLLAFYSHISNAQSGAEVIAFDADTIPVVTKTISSEARLNKLEEEIQAIKKDNESLKKQMNQLRSALPNIKRKISVSRVGSKQVVLE